MTDFPQRDIYNKNLRQRSPPKEPPKPKKRHQETVSNEQDKKRIRSRFCHFHQSYECASRNNNSQSISQT
uniref:Ovule protein n=1 Tax=Caenorhabditis tropicalis TaxID=1561998 RepID=A0A1I7U0U7_9PELO